MQKKLLPLLLSLVVLGLYACSSNPGISSPVRVNGVEFQIVSASLHESYTIGSQEYSPQSTGDLLLLVRAIVTESDNDIDLDDWKARVWDASGRESNTDMQSKITGTVEGQEGTFLEWFFVVDRFAQDLTMKVRGQEINLSPILVKDSGN